MTRAILEEFHTKLFPWSGQDSVRIWEALERALDHNDELLEVILDGEDA